jgi:hypothetical protein
VKGVEEEFKASLQPKEEAYPWVLEEKFNKGRQEGSGSKEEKGKI